MNTWRLEMKNINKSFVSMKALSDVSFYVKPGETHALLGMNGAGKSTLMKVLCGAYTKDSGDIFLDGQKVEINSTQDAIECGIATVYQHPNLVESFTGYENIYLGSESTKKGLLTGINRSDMKKKAKALAERYHVHVDLEKSVSEMKPVERELVCILEALSHNPKILILDEPTSILTRKEKDGLFDVVRELNTQNVSDIFVTHRLDEVNEICHELTVLRDGLNVDSIRIGDGLDTSYIAELMLGKKINKLYPEKSKTRVDSYELKVENLSYHNRVKEVSFQAGRQEILGIYGLVGSGIDELSKLLFGALRKTNGHIYMNGVEINYKHPQEAIDNGFFLVPGDRKTEGYVGKQDIATNLTISNISRISMKGIGIVNNSQKKQDAVEMIKKLNIATPNEKKQVAELSGGNQQKVVVGKGLYTNADVYIFAEPTIGVDVGARNGIYEIMRSLSEDSIVILVTSDIEELYGMSDRIVVLNSGRKLMDVYSENTNINEILLKAVSEIERK